ncbi:ribulose-phosphate 3-epimerase [Candidatus Woesearchaeota archaeon]|nr:ribulose-phosphate 3-epimerase [Candidatus Woesearchaeota archaeon]
MNQIKIAPSILAIKDINQLESEIKKLEAANANIIHIDVMDGIFVENKTPFLDVKITAQIKKTASLPLDVHLMVQEPEKYIESFIEAGADLISIHCESKANHNEAIKKIQTAGKKAGIAINPATPIEKILPYCETADFILVMTVVPGKGGQQYIESANEKIQKLRHLFPNKNIEVDGGIKTENIYIPLNAGANIIVSGTGIFKTINYKETIQKMKQAIIIGADHAGFQLKEKVKQFLQEKKYAVIDAGTNSEESCDYPDIAKKVAEEVSKDATKKGILICGTGIGMSIAANKYKNIRAAHVTTAYEAEMAKKHNDANILCLGARTTEEKIILECIEKWLSSEFEAGKHERRVGKIE